MKRNTLLVALACILLLATFLRLDSVRHTNIDKPLRQDAAQYTAYAYNLYYHGVYSSDPSTLQVNSVKPEPDALRTPGYPLFLRVLVVPEDYKAFLKNTAYLQAIISILTLLIIGYLAFSTTNNYMALMALLATVISPHLIIMNSYVLSETLFTFFLIATIALIAFSVKNSKIYIFLLGICCLAITSLIRPTTQFFILFFLIYLWVTLKPPIRNKYIIIGALSYLLIFSVWVIRNYISLGVISDPTLAINSLHHGLYPGFMYNNNPETFGYPYRYDPESEIIATSIGSVVATLINRFNESPVEYLLWYLSKPLTLLQWEMIQGEVDIFIYQPWSSPYFLDNGIFPITRQIMEALHPLFVWLSLAGMVLALATSSPIKNHKHGLLTIKLIALLYFYFLIVHIAVAPFPRYSIPLRPFTYILSAYTLQYIYFVLSSFYSQRHKTS